ncbi:hypothetical protein P22_3796 [Propionispora sp. 2/2-37]|uniref:DUF6263 family protein n=1 Tax=Propionispora sp. 2/2-37 TaxID=1677858 RepID=UPI0006BB89D8|nr:DUF6263 family protein [Propionispora sp. 2/2-37]CUH97661.1 hypothetical protein P22_3796 [Propionispora sp. 2/2-37]
MKLRNMAAIWIFLCILLTAGGYQRAFAFNLDVAQGDQYLVHMVNNQETAVTLKGKETRVKETMDMQLSMNITAVNEEKVTIQYRYDALKVNTQTDGRQTTYDSRISSPNDLLSGLYGGLIGKGFTVVMDKQGKILSVSGIDKLLQEMTDDIPGTEAQKQAFKNMLKQSFSDEAMKSMLEQAMRNYPAEIKEGDRWEEQYNVKVIFPLTVHDRWEVVSDRNGALDLAVVSNIGTDSANNAADFMGVETRLNLKGESQGIIHADKQNGFLQNGAYTQSIKGTILLPSGKATSEGLEIPITINSQMTYTITKQTELESLPV